MERVFKILAVDNEPSVTTALRYVFDGPQYDITCVGSGVDALARLDYSTPFDVIIVDQKMPKLTSTPNLVVGGLEPSEAWLASNNPRFM